MEHQVMSSEMTEKQKRKERSIELISRGLNSPSRPATKIASLRSTIDACLNMLNRLFAIIRM